MSAFGTQPVPAGTCQAVTASTTAPVSFAWRMAQRSAALDDSKPSTPTTMRRCSMPCLLFIANLLRICHVPVRDGLDAVTGGLRIEILTTQGIRAQVRSEPVDQRDAGGELQLGDPVVRDGLEVLDQRPQRVAVRDDEHATAGAQIPDDRVVPVRQQPGGDVREG